MGDQGAKALEIIAGIILVCLLIGVAFKIYNKAASASDTATQQIDNMTNMMNTSQYTNYDGKTVKGNEVLSAIATFSSDTITVEVVNANGSDTNYIYADETLTTKSTEKIADAKNKQNVTTVYIDPSNDYLGEILYDGSGSTIVGIKFTQVTATP